MNGSLLQSRSGSYLQRFQVEHRVVHLRGDTATSGPKSAREERPNEGNVAAETRRTRVTCADNAQQNRTPSIPGDDGGGRLKTAEEPCEDLLSGNEKRTQRSWRTPAYRSVATTPV